MSRPLSARRSRVGAILIVLGLVAATMAIMPAAWSSESGTLVVEQYPATGTFFSATISGTGSWNGTYGAWCADKDHPLWPGVFYSAVVDAGASGVIDKPENLDLVNWLLNNTPPGYGMWDIQGAIWLLLDNNPGGTTANAQTLAAAAIANGEGFVPGCGQYYLVVVAPVWPSGGQAQTIIIVLQRDPCPRYGRITVDKITEPAGSLQLFNFNRSWGVDFQLADGSAPYDSGETLTPGSGFSVSEDPVAGWMLSSASCVSSVSGAVDPSNFPLAAGERVDCVFHNSRDGRIIVRKVTTAGAPAQVFSFDPSWPGPNFTLSDGGSADSGPLAAPGVYSVAELMPMPAGWSLTGASCDDGSAVNAIGLSPGETVTCTFTNTYEQVEGPKGSLTIIKDATALVEPDDTMFGFAGTWAFELADGGSQTFAELEAGDYTVSELLPDGWEFDRVECIADDYEASGPSVTVNLGEGEAAQCTFYNSQEEEVLGPTGSLTIIKQTVPAGGTGFSFTPSENLGDPFILDDDGSQMFSELEAGAYTVTEIPAADWEFAQVECSALDYTTDGASVTVNLAEGEAAVCTFTNGELPYTGSQPFMPVLLIAGLWSVLMGLGMMVWSTMRRASA